MPFTLYFKQRLIAVAVLFLGILLAFFSGAHIQASFAFLPVDGAIKVYYKNKSNQELEFSKLIESAKNSIKKHASPKYLSALGLLYYLSATTNQQQSTQLLQSSLAFFSKSIEQSPVQPMSWFRIALIQHRQSYLATYVTNSLEMSILTGRMTRVLLIPRISLALSYFEHSDEEFHALLLDQIKLAQKFELLGLKKLLQKPYYLDKMKTLIKKHNNFKLGIDLS